MPRVLTVRRGRVTPSEIGYKPNMRLYETTTTTHDKYQHHTPDDIRPDIKLTGYTPAMHTPTESEQYKTILQNVAMSGGIMLAPQAATNVGGFLMGLGPAGWTLLATGALASAGLGAYYMSGSGFQHSHHHKLYC